MGLACMHASSMLRRICQLQLAVFMSYDSMAVVLQVEATTVLQLPLLVTHTFKHAPSTLVIFEQAMGGIGRPISNRPTIAVLPKKKH